MTKTTRTHRFKALGGVYMLYAVRGLDVRKYDSRNVIIRGNGGVMSFYNLFVASAI